MSNLYANITPDTGASEAHRPSNNCIETWAQTAQARVTVSLTADNYAEVTVWPVKNYKPDVDGIGWVVWRGHIDNVGEWAGVPFGNER